MKTTFDPKQNRLSYGDLLTAPNGFVLKKAVCTTYSLDLQTLVASTVALGLGEATDSDLANNPLNLLSALQKVTDKMLVFCDSSQIYSVNDKKRNRFLGLLEKTIIPVSLKTKDFNNNYPSFHPKCWILQFVDVTNDNIRKYRLIVLSRNLTFDRSWDVTVSFDGNENNAPDPQTQRLIGFVEFLKQQIGVNDVSVSDTQKSFLDELIEELKNVKFEIDDTKFDSFEILPLGIGQVDIKLDELFTKTLSTIYIMSPFISKSVIQRLLCNEHNYYGQKLITRESELYKIKDLPRLFCVYCLKDEVIDYEINNSEGDGSQSKSEDIHAKIYLTVLSGKVGQIYLGSMNASETAVNRNVELMVKLKSLPQIVYDFRDELQLWNVKGSFAEINFDNYKFVEKGDVDAKAEQAMKTLCRLEMTAHISSNDIGNYDIVIDIPNCADYGLHISLSPFFAKGLVEPIAPMMRFKNLTISQLSEFYNITINSDDGSIERTIKIPTTNMPEEREKSIITSIVSSKKKLSEYIAFILGDDFIGSFAEDVAELIDGDSDNMPSTNTTDNDELTPIYERMLKSSVTNPDRIKEIESVIQMIDDENIVTPEFKKMYQTFKTTLQL